MKGLLIVLSGPSGAGKGTVLKNALERNDNLVCSVSATTRQPRPGETDGVNYFFLDKEKFLRMARDGEFLEYQEVYGNYYGTPKSYVDRLRAEGRDVVLEIDVKGAMSVKERESDAVMIFLTPKDEKTLRERLIGRNTESGEALSTRLSAAKDEIKEAKYYDYLVINEIVGKCAEDILNIIRAEKCRIERNLKVIKTF